MHVEPDHPIVMRVRQAIVDGCLQPGSQLKPLELAEKFSTSTAPVRDALIRLSERGLVCHKHHRGFEVRRLRIDDVVESHYLLLDLYPSILARMQYRPVHGNERHVYQQESTRIQEVPELPVAELLERLSLIFNNVMLSYQQARVIGPLLDITKATREAYLTTACDENIVRQEIITMSRATVAGDFIDVAYRARAFIEKQLYFLENDLQSYRAYLSPSSINYPR